MLLDLTSSRFGIDPKWISGYARTELAYPAIAALITSDEVDVKCGEEVEVTQFGPNLVAAVNGYAGVRKTNHLSFEFRDKSDGRGKPHLALRIVRPGASDCALRIAHCALRIALGA